MKTWARLGLAALSAALMVLSVPTVNLWPLMWVALAPLLHLATTAASPRRAFLEGWLAGVAANTAAFYWMQGLLQRFGHMPAWQALPVTMLLTTYQGLEFALLAWGVHRLRRRWPGGSTAAIAALVMVAIELVVPQIFPFYIAISQAGVPALIQIADVTGPLGVSFALMLVNGGLYDAWLAARAARAAAAANGAATGGGASGRVLAKAVLGRLALPLGVLGFLLAYGAVRIHQIDARRAVAPKARVGIVQANVGIQEKWDPDASARLLALHQQQSASLAARGADLLVWPESSYPYTLSRRFQADYPEGDQRRILAGYARPTLFGALTVAPERQAGTATGKDRFPYNTAFMMAEDGRVTGFYDKVFLLVFGEYIPFYDHVPWFTRAFPEASNFSRGEEPASFPFRLHGRDFRLGPLICYEDILPGFTRRVAALDPHLLVNITNDAWFGKTTEPYQHLALAVFRSVEHRLDMVRAVNTGVSTHVDAAGRVRALADAADPDAEPKPAPVSLLVEAALLDRGGIYARVGDLFGYGCLVALVVLMFRAPPGAARLAGGAGGGGGGPRRRHRRRKKG